MNFFRNLKPNEVELKPCFIDTKNLYVQLLIYKTARTDFNLLDETYGLNWKSSFKDINGVVYCTLSVLNDGEWISREDCGDNGNELSPEKSQASSAIKRAGAQLGIGRELYNAPDIKINLNQSELSEDGKRLKTKFKVKSMTISPSGEFTELTVHDNKGNVRFSYPYNNKEKSETKNRLEELKDFCTTLSEQGEDKTVIRKFYDFLKQPDKQDSTKTVAETRKVWNLTSMWKKWREREF